MRLSKDPVIEMYIHYCLSVMILCALFMGILYAMVSASSMPDVHFSNSTKECVRVINYDERFDYNCSNYPDKYNLVWVQ